MAAPSPFSDTTLRPGQATAAPTASGMPWPIAPPVSASQSCGRAPWVCRKIGRPEVTASSEIDRSVRHVAGDRGADGVGVELAGRRAPAASMALGGRWPARPARRPAAPAPPRRPRAARPGVGCAQPSGHQHAGHVRIGEEGDRRVVPTSTIRSDAGEVGQRHLAEILILSGREAPAAARLAGDEGVGQHAHARRREPAGRGQAPLAAGLAADQHHRLGGRLDRLGRGVDLSAAGAGRVGGASTGPLRRRPATRRSRPAGSGWPSRPAGLAGLTASAASVAGVVGVARRLAPIRESGRPSPRCRRSSGASYWRW